MSSDFRQGFIAGAAFVAFCLAVWVVAYSQDWLVASGLAIHLDGEKHCNSITEGLGYERGDYAVGFYRNSQCKPSFYAARSWLPIQYRNLRLGITAGGVTGYGRPITPVAGLAATYEQKTWGIDLLYVPPFKGSGDVIWVTVKRRF
jgi:hypothetical protein